MKTTSKLIVATSLTLLCAQTQAVDFSFMSSPVTPEVYGNSYSQTVDTVTLTATAWSTTGIRGRFQTAELENSPGFGFGVCNRAEHLDCSTTNNANALDNRGADDLILFTFSSSVKLDALEFLQVGGDSDLALWAGKGPINLDGIQSRDLGLATFVNNNNSLNSSRTVALASSFNGLYDWIAVSSRINQNNDFAFLTSFTVHAVPEAETWSMMLAALGLIGFAVRRRM